MVFALRCAQSNMQGAAGRMGRRRLEVPAEDARDREERGMPRVGRRGVRAPRQAEARDRAQEGPVVPSWGGKELDRRGRSDHRQPALPEPPASPV